MTPVDKYVAHETRMQKFRWVTPIGVFSNTIALAVIGWFVLNLYTGMQKDIDHQGTKLDCVIHNLDKCCKDDGECV